MLSTTSLRRYDIFLFSRTQAALASAAARLAEMRHAVAGRRALARMDARMLADIGISPSEAAQEIGRRPWDTNPAIASRSR